MLRTSPSTAFVAAALVIFAASSLLAQSFSPTPDKTSRDRVRSELESGDEPSIDAAIKEIHFWVDQGDPHLVPREFDIYWLPDLIKLHRYRDVVDLSLAGAVANPNTRGLSHMLRLRAQALVALGRPQDALLTAKMYYNVCALQDTDDAIDQVAICLDAVNPNDDSVSRRFRAEQMMASSDPGAASQPSATLKSLRIDPGIFDQPVWNKWVERRRFDDKIGYGNLLLVVDRGREAEKVFRGQLKVAKTVQQHTTAIEGIARSLRAEDGNLARANAWLAALQQGQTASTQPAH